MAAHRARNNIRINTLMTNGQQQLIYVGTYTELTDLPSRSESIYIYDFDSDSGKLDLRSVIHDVANPSFLTISKDRRHLFAVNELAEFAGIPGGGVSALSLHPDSASFINAQPTHGAYPCYIMLDSTEKWVLVANYGGGNITVLPIADDGSLGAATAVIQNQGQTGPQPEQDKPHAHCVIFAPDQQYVFVADLGLDQILIFRFDSVNGQLLPHAVPTIATEPGAGPRHLEFHPNGRYLYVSNELNSTIGIYEYDPDQGTLKQKQIISTLPHDFAGSNSVADIRVARSGLFLYVSNRGHDTIAVFAIDPNQGTVSLVEIVSSGGQKPRNFALDLNDNFLLVAHQDSHNLVVFQVDKNSGRLTQTDHTLSIPSPVCVRVVAGNETET
jgi:6-phosphogluconolactonase